MIKNALTVYVLLINSGYFNFEMKLHIMSGSVFKSLHHWKQDLPPPLPFVPQIALLPPDGQKNITYDKGRGKHIETEQK